MRPTDGKARAVLLATTAAMRSFPLVDSVVTIIARAAATRVDDGPPEIWLCFPSLLRVARWRGGYHDSRRRQRVIGRPCPRPAVIIATTTTVARTAATDRSRRRRPAGSPKNVSNDRDFPDLRRVGGFRVAPTAANTRLITISTQQNQSKPATFVTVTLSITIVTAIIIIIIIVYDVCRRLGRGPTSDDGLTGRTTAAVHQRCAYLPTVNATRTARQRRRRWSCCWCCYVLLVATCSHIKDANFPRPLRR